MLYTGKASFWELIKYRNINSKKDPVIYFKDETLSYQKIYDKGKRLANFFLATGYEKGDKCAVMLPNNPESIIIWAGAAAVGIVEVPISTSIRGDLLAYILNKSDSEVLITTPDKLEDIHQIANELEKLKEIIVVGNGTHDKMIPFNYHRFQDVITLSDDKEISIEVSAIEPSIILFTSGTTGPSKGVVLTHQLNFKLGYNTAEVMEYTEEDRLFTAYPLSHANARYTSVLPAMLVDADIVLHDKFSIANFWEICKQNRVTAFNALGSLFTLLMKQDEKPIDSTHGVKKAYGGPTPVEIYDDFIERFRIEITEIYGLTETGTTTVNPAKAFRKGSCGYAVPHYEVEIHDDDGNKLAAGEIGEIVIRPKEPYIMFQEYYKMPQETLKAFQNLWFHTGDRGRIDEDGYLYFMDRKKDAIRRRGENISSFEVEKVINKFPDIVDCAVLGIPSDLPSDEEVLAVIQLKEGRTFDFTAFLEFCTPRLPHYAIPRYVRIVDEFPRTPSQRIQKFKLKKEGITKDLGSPISRLLKIKMKKYGKG